MLRRDLLDGMERRTAEGDIRCGRMAQGGLVLLVRCPIALGMRDHKVRLWEWPVSIA